MRANKALDIFIIGGGINGVGIAADAATRGYTTTLCEQGDLANGTSSASSKLIHGGLRYLEYYEFRLVREALKERETLMTKAPHLIYPMSFVLPHQKHLRPAWMIRCGLFLYDHIAPRKFLPASRSICLDRTPEGIPLADEIKKGFVYSDCWVDDARLVVLNAMEAQKRGANILTRERCIKAEKTDTGLWQVTTKNLASGVETTHFAKTLVNAAGPWVESISTSTIKDSKDIQLKLVKGSHIVVPKLYEGEHAYILQNEDQRIVFVLPFQDNYSLVGTTDVAYVGDPKSVSISEDEKRYLCDIVSTYFKSELKASQICWSYSGIRPLFDDNENNPSAVSRDYKLDIEQRDDTGPLLTVLGGKLTTYRCLAKDAVDKLSNFLPKKDNTLSTAKTILPGGDLPDGNFEQFLHQLSNAYPWLPAELCYRYARNYGSQCNHFLYTANALEELGIHFGHGLYEAEVNYLIQSEWAKTCEDILWRRTKLGLVFNDEQTEHLKRWLEATTAYTEAAIAS